MKKIKQHPISYFIFTWTVCRAAAQESQLAWQRIAGALVLRIRDGGLKEVESWANRLHTAPIGSYSGWPPLRCVRTASPTSHTIVVQGGLHLLVDCHGRCNSEIPKRYTGARDTMFARSARNNWDS